MSIDPRKQNADPIESFRQHQKLLEQREKHEAERIRTEIERIRATIAGEMTGIIGMAAPIQGIPSAIRIMAQEAAVVDIKAERKIIILHYADKLERAKTDKQLKAELDLLEKAEDKVRAVHDDKEVRAAASQYRTAYRNVLEFAGSKEPNIYSDSFKIDPDKLKLSDGERKEYDKLLAEMQAKRIALLITTRDAVKRVGIEDQDTKNAIVIDTAELALFQARTQYWQARPKRSNALPGLPVKDNEPDREPEEFPGTPGPTPPGNPHSIMPGGIDR